METEKRIFGYVKVMGMGKHCGEGANARLYNVGKLLEL
jgi:hypothetical protein